MLDATAFQPSTIVLVTLLRVSNLRAPKSAGTLPEANIIGGWKMNFLLGWPFFSGANC